MNLDAVDPTFLWGMVGMAIGFTIGALLRTIIDLKSELRKLREWRIP